MDPVGSVLRVSCGQDATPSGVRDDLMHSSRKVRVSCNHFILIRNTPTRNSIRDRACWGTCSIVARGGGGWVGA